MPPPLSDSAADRNLLFGILALQMDFISRDQLVAGMNAWVLEKTKPLGQILVEQRALREDLQAALAVMVEKHVEVHGQDAQQSLQSLSSLGTAQQVLQQVADAEVQASLAQWSTASNADDSSSPQQATTLGLPTSAGSRFRILRPHARGGLGQVYVAHDEELHREVALKEIQEHSADNPVARTRFQLEAEITGGLEHPGIVPVYGLGHHPDGRPFYAMRFIRGDSLKVAIERFHGQRQGDKEKRRQGEAEVSASPLLPVSSSFSSVSFRKLLGRFIDVCNAVAYAHSRGVLHRDLKPGNIMLGRYGETLVVDWGIAKSGHEPSAASEEGALLPPSRDDPSSKTVAGTAVGTPAFMSPEQAAGRLDLVSPASDIYSLGTTLYVLLTGKLPFPDKDSGEILQKVQRGEFALPRQIQPAVPAPLAAICCKAMALRPPDRYATPLELAADIENWLADEPVRAWAEPASVRMGRWMRKHKPAVTGIAAAFLVGLVAVGVGTVWRQTERARRETEQAQREAEEQVREAEAARKHAVAEQAIREALDQADQSRRELQAHLQQPGGVFALLNEPARWQGYVQSSQAAVERALAVLANAQDASPNPELTQRARRLRDLAAQDDEIRLLALRLEKIRLDRSTILGAGFDNAIAARAYPRAFAEAKVPVYDPDPARGAAAIRASPIKELLVAALDDWAGVALRSDQFDLVQQLLALARHADPDPDWRDSFRQPRLWRNPDALAELVQEAPADLSPQTAAAIAILLPRGSVERESLLRRTLARYPADFWLNLQLAGSLRNRPAEAAAFARTAVAVRPHSAAAWNNLANLLAKHGRVEEALQAYDRALALEPDNAALHSNLGGTLRDQKQLKRALAVLEKAVTLDPKHGDAWNNLGTVLGELNRVDESLQAHQMAVELNPLSAESQNNLGAALRAVDEVELAIAAYQQAIKLDPKHAAAYSNLGLALHARKRFAESAEACRTAIELNPKSAIAYNHLGMALDDLGRSDEAIIAFRRAIELQPNLAEAHYNLGLVLEALQRVDEAVPALRKSVAIEPGLPHRQGALGRALLRQGAFAEALAATQKAFDLLPANHGLRPLVSRQLRDCRRALALDKQLAEVVDRNAPAASEQLLELAQFCQTYLERYPTAVRLYRQAFTQEPNLIDDLDRQSRYNAACAAALAGLGRGPQAVGLPEVERISLRRQARDWLQADLDVYMKQARGDSVKPLVGAEDRLSHWQKDADFAGCRNPKELAKLPEAERRSWQMLWDDVEQTLTIARARFRETRLKGVLSAKETSQVHSVKTSGAKVYVIDLESSAFDTILKIEDENGNVRAENDDISKSNLNSRIVLLEPPHGAVMRLVVTAFRRGSAGPYRLRIRELLDGK